MEKNEYELAILTLKDAQDACDRLDTVCKSTGGQTLMQVIKTLVACVSMLMLDHEPKDQS